MSTYLIVQVLRNVYIVREKVNYLHKQFAIYFTYALSLGRQATSLRMSGIRQRLTDTDLGSNWYLGINPLLLSSICTKHLPL